jgi:hypothetical protein
MSCIPRSKDIVLKDCRAAGLLLVGPIRQQFKGTIGLYFLCKGVALHTMLVALPAIPHMLRDSARRGDQQGFPTINAVFIRKLPPKI